MCLCLAYPLGRKYRQILHGCSTPAFVFKNVAVGVAGVIWLPVGDGWGIGSIGQSIPEWTTSTEVVAIAIHPVTGLHDLAVSYYDLTLDVGYTVRGIHIRGMDVGRYDSEDGGNSKET